MNETVLTRPEQMAVHGLSNADLDRLLAGFATLAEPVELHFLWRPQLSDPKDEMVPEAAGRCLGDLQSPGFCGCGRPFRRPSRKPG
ncbi:hypothetical protein [Mesorhizobium sp.]|uniref:hypothetical protein n=1 Tax=Mesorhizobium sp. TaxID=1871066 RepID=UPI0025EB212C|nr:hypothetical protein [Mesorhizobium sp.]